MATLNKQTKEVELGYLAGIVDGEGTIGVYRCRQTLTQKRTWGYRLFLLIATTDVRLADWMKATFGAKIRMNRSDYYSKNGWKNPWRIEFCTKEAKRLISLIYPYLIIKKEQAALALQFPTNYEQCPQLRESIYSRMKELNKRGCAVAETECESAVNSGDATVRTERNKNFQRIDESQFRLSLDLN